MAIQEYCFRMTDAQHKPTAESILKAARTRGMRRTRALERIVQLLVGSSGPLAIRYFVEHPEMENVADQATIYRTLSRLEHAGLVRRIGLHERAAHYILAAGEDHNDYVVCVDCGKVEALEMHCPVDGLEKQVSRDTGFSGVYHELQFYGHCPDCEGH